MRKTKILLSWLCLAGGSYFFFSGAREFFAPRLAQKQAEEAWKAESAREASEQDGQIVPPGARARSVVPAGETFDFECWTFGRDIVVANFGGDHARHVTADGDAPAIAATLDAFVRVVGAGARKSLLQAERRRFLAEEWPRIHATIQRLGLTPEELLDPSPTRRPGSKPSKEGR